MKRYQWGIVGLGTIVHEFVESFNQETSELTAAASRASEKAEKFAHRYDIPKTYGSCQETSDDAETDTIYIAVPNKQHIDYILAASEVGKHILCEKAITTDEKELADTMRLVEEESPTLVEVVTIFNMLLYQQLRSIMDTGKLGALKMIQASFGSYKEPDPENRFLNPESAGGALLDTGTYAVSFARFFSSSQPEVVASTTVSFEIGVDEQSVTILRNKENEPAAVSLTFQVKMPKVGIIASENGYVTIADYPRVDRVETLSTDGARELIKSGSTSEAMNYEIDNMVYMIGGDLLNRSLLLTKDVIDILDQTQVLWQNMQF